jgi:polyhydroxyalkanoate synthase
LRTPLLIVPPWINKFYILDLKPEKSFIKWCVDQGVTVFVISWVNPDKSLGGKTFDDYMKQGPLAAMDVIEQITGELKVHTMGYCVGGTLLASTLAWLAEKRRVRATSATFLAAQVDFTHAGDLMVFVDEEQISALEKDMQAAGVLEGSKMAMAFNMLRSNDLIWSYVVSNYLKGKPPSAFDLLHWNSDATRMPAANHSFYLRNCYLENRLSTGSMVLDNTRLDLSKVKVPVYNLATREDHIAPAESVLYGSQFFGGPVKYVLSGSGHIAGVVNPPASGKYQYWTNDKTGATSVAEWLKGAQEHKGSWWPDWREWLAGIDPEQVPARAVGTDALPPLEDAPGSYVRVRA